MLLSEHVYCVAITFKMTQWVEQQNCMKFYNKLEHFIHGNYSDDSEGFQGRYNECSANKSVTQILQRWSRICWKGSMFWKACTKQNTWECWTCMGCNQQRLMTDSVRTRSWSEDSKNYCVWDFDAGSWHEFVLWLLPPEQKEDHAAVANDLIQTATNESSGFSQN